MDIFICLLQYLIRLLEMNNDDYDDEYFFCQQQFLQSCSECYILLEKYKLRTHIVGFNMEKEQIHYSYQYLQRRLTQRYTDIEKRLLQGLKNLHKNFLVAKGNALRAANNIFCNFRRRVGLLSNDPLSTLKYNKYDAQEKILLETMLYNDKDNKQRIQALKAKLQEDLQQSTQQINQKYKLNDKIKQEFSKAFEVLDKCQCYTYKYYQNFQRSMILSLSTWQANFDKLNGFLSVWENIASIKAFEALTKKQIQSDQKNHDRQRQQRYHEDKTEEQLQQLMGNYPQNSAMREEYKKRLVQLRRNTVQKQKKLDNFGRMYNKRKTRPGILVNSFKNVSVIDYYQNVDSQKRHFSFKDEFKTFKANQSDQIMNDYRLTPYQMQKSFRNVEQIKTHMQRYQKSSILNFEWHYDRFGRGASYNIITNFNQQIQKKIEFECIRQVQLIQRDDIRKRQMFQRNAQLMKQAEKKQSILIGLRRLSDKNQLQWLNQRKYTPQYIPQLVQQDGEELHFSSDQQQPQTQIKAKEKVHEYNESDELLYSKVVNFAEEFQEEIKIQSLIKVLQVPKIQNNIISTQIQNEPKQKAPNKIIKKVQRKQSSSQGEDQQQLQFEQPCLQKQIIHKYFREYSRKIIRKQTDPYYKKTYFFYYKHYSSIDPLFIAKYIDFQNLFLITSHEIILINKIFSNQQKIKCYIYLIQHNGEEEREEPLKQLINKIYTDTILTVKFQEVYLQDSSGQNMSFFIIGLISVLIKFNNMPEDFQFNDYILQGKEIVQDFKVYYYPQEYELQKQKLMKKFQSFAPKDFFAPLKKRENKPGPKQIANNDLNEMQQQVTKGEIQNKQKVQVNNQIKPPVQQISSFKHENQSTIVSIINENVSQLKRSNSKQQIASSNIQQQMTALKAQQFNQEQQDDYQAL